MDVFKLYSQKIQINKSHFLLINIILISLKSFYFYLGQRILLAFLRCSLIKSIFCVRGREEIN